VIAIGGWRAVEMRNVLSWVVREPGACADALGLLAFAVGATGPRGSVPVDR